MNGSLKLEPNGPTDRPTDYLSSHSSTDVENCNVLKHWSPLQWKKLRKLKRPGGLDSTSETEKPEKYWKTWKILESLSQIFMAISVDKIQKLTKSKKVIWLWTCTQIFMAISVQKNQNLTKSYDNGHNFTKSYDSEHPHKYSWPFQWKKSEFNKIIW